MADSISVVIPTHNRPVLLKRAILSVLCQSILPYEVIVVDDLNDSATRNVCINFESDILRYIPNVERKGAPSSRNLGVRSASAEYIAFLDDDDSFSRKKIQKVLEVIRKNRLADIIYHPAYIHMVNENVSYYSNPDFFSTSEQFYRHLLIRNFVGGTPMTIVRRNFFIANGGFNEWLDALEDYEFWLRCAKNNGNFLYFNEPLTDCFYYTGERSVSKLISSNVHALNYIRDVYKEDYSELDDKDINNNLIWELKMIVHKALLNKKRIDAIKTQFLLFKRAPTLANLMLLPIILLGEKVVFRLRAKIKK